MAIHQETLGRRNAAKIGGSWAAKHLFAGLVNGASMARADGNLALEELYRALMDRRFDFMPRGEHHIRQIYQTVTERHSELCDDTYLCSASCKDGTNSPEWQHVVRAVLKNIQARGGPVSKGDSRGLWQFGNASCEPLTEEEIFEGRRLLKLHKVKERKPQIVRRKKMLYSKRPVGSCAKHADSISLQFMASSVRVLQNATTGCRLQIMRRRHRRSSKT